MRWSLKLSVELDTGEAITYELAHLDREEAFVAPASLGLTIDEGKQILAAVQTHMVTDQIARHNQALKDCRFCGRQVRTKGYYRSVFKSVFGKVPMRLRRVWGCECRGVADRTFSSMPTAKNPTAPELNYLTAKLAALMPFGKVADLLGELLPASASTNAVTVRTRTMRVGRRLEKTADTVPIGERPDDEPRMETSITLDGAYVRDRNQGAERNFEVIVGKVSTGESATRFAFVRMGTDSAARRVRKVLTATGYADGSKITMLSDGDVGLRAIQYKVAPQAEHILDWFHLAMRFQHVSQTIVGLTGDQVQPIVKQWLSAKIDRAKWSCWNGKAVKGLRYLKDIDEWLTWSRKREIPGLSRLAMRLAVLAQYLNANRDSLPNYGKRYRADRPISTAPAESTVNEVIAKRMVKKQQMRWNRHTVQPFLNVRAAVVNDTLEQDFRKWHRNFRPVTTAA